MSPDHAPDPVLRIADLIERSSLNDPALRRLYARIPHRTPTRRSTPAPIPSAVTGFAARLNELFDAMPTPGGRPHTNSAVAAQLTAWGHPISKPYLSQLRSGARTNPSRETIAALARYFRVRPDHFATAAHPVPRGHDLDLLARLQFPGLRGLAIAAVDLSEESQHLLVTMAERLRLTEGLPEVGAGGLE